MSRGRGGAVQTSRVLVLTTGGTIASRTEHGRKVYFGGPGQSPDVPLQAPDGVEVTFEEIASVGSQDMSLAIWRKLNQRISGAFGQDRVDAVVVTHGTDTLEETAFLLDCLHPPANPVVLVGAMRPADAPDADGPENLADAIAVAAAPASRNRGVLVVMAGEIHGARDVRKAFVDGVYTLASSGAGVLGDIVAGKPRYARPPFPSTLSGRLALPDQGPLPRVAIWHGGADMDCDLPISGASDQAAGIVTAGFGNGNLSQPVIRTLAQMVQDGVHVIRSTRVAGARVDDDGEVDDRACGFIVSRGLSPQKSRLLLQLLLATGSADATAIRDAFNCF